MEAEREKFRTYVEKSGLMASLTNVLVTLYEEPNKPTNALDYVIETLSKKSVGGKRIEILEQRCNELEAENKKLKEKLASIVQPPQEQQIAAEKVSSSPDAPKES